MAILGSLNVASKEWIIRQYDHEVQGGSVLKPLVGVEAEGPGDAAVVRPKLDSQRGLVVGCGINPHYGDFDTYSMAASAIDEAIRNCVAVGADPACIALLDNFCWGDCERSETLGSLVRATLACHDLSLAFEAPFISGKDSLNNEFSYVDDQDQKQTIAIPPTLLISAMGQVDEVSRCVTMDLKRPGDLLYVVGATKQEFGGSHLNLVNQSDGGFAPSVDPAVAKQTFTALHRAIQAGCIAACHDLSEGGLAVALAEMALAGGLGVEADVTLAPLIGEYASDKDRAVAALFSESNSRFVCEVPAAKQQEVEDMLQGVPFAQIGGVTEGRSFILHAKNEQVIATNITRIKEAWQKPLRHA